MARKVGDRLAKGLGGVVGKVAFEDLESGVEHRHEHRHVDGRLVVGLLVEVVLPEVDDLELGLLPVGQRSKILAGLLVARAAADHLPELDARLHRLHEDQIDDLGDVDAGVEHVHGDGDARQVVLLELGDEAVAVAAVVDALGRGRDDLRDADVLRVHLLEDLGDAVGMLLGHREDDGLAGQLAGLVLEADLHDLFPLLAQRVLVADLDFDVRAGVVEAVGVDALLDEGVAVLLAEVHALDALALETGLRLVQAEIDEEAFFHGLLVVVEKGRRVGVAVEDPEGVAVDEVGRRGGQADHAGVEVLDDFGEPLEDRAVGFVEDDEVEETGAELGVAERHRLLGGDEEAFGLVDLMRVDPVARLVRQVGLEAIGQGLIDEGVAVGEEENVLRLIGAEKDVDQGHGSRVLPVPVAMTRSARRLLAAKASATRRMASCW